MRKLISILAVLVLCLTLTVTAFATDDGFVSSPGQGGTPCDHEITTVVDQKDPTCTTDGYTGDAVCAECGEIVEEGKVIPAAGHNMVDGVCSVCGTPDVPQTGDNSQMMLWTSVMAVSAIAVVAVMYFARKTA